MSELRLSCLWRHGPDWLNGKFTLDDGDEPTEMPEECSKELRTSNKKTHNLATILKSSALLVISYSVKGSAASGE